MEKEQYEHPAFGQISFGRTQGSNTFYGSDLNLGHYINFEIKTSVLSRSLTDDHFYGDKTILKGRMTNIQFSDMITNMNRGEGIPCTLEYCMDGKLQKVPPLEVFDNRKDHIQKEMQMKMKKFADSLKEGEKRMSEILKKPTISKKDREELESLYKLNNQKISSDIPFYLECFQEGMDKVVLEARSEVESSIQYKIQQYGLEELHRQNKLLGNKED